MSTVESTLLPPELMAQLERLDDALALRAQAAARYQEALGGIAAIKKIQSETRHGEFEGPGIQGKATFVGSVTRLTRFQLSGWASRPRRGAPGWWGRCPR